MGESKKLQEAARVIRQVIGAIRLPEDTASATILRTLSDQPLATWSIEREGESWEVQVFMGLRAGVAPRTFENTFMISSVALSGSAIEFSPEAIAAMAGSHELPEADRVVPRPEAPPNAQETEFIDREPLDDLLRQAEGIMRDIARAEDGRRALQRADEWGRPIWSRTILPLQAPGSDVGARIWTSGAEATCAESVRLLTRHAALRDRLRICQVCDELLLTPLQSGPARARCAIHGTLTKPRDERRRLREALELAGCPSPASVALLAQRRGCRGVDDLRASVDAKWLEEAVHRQFSRQRVSARLAGALVEQVLHRLRTPPLRGRSGDGGWGTRAFEELGLPLSPLPTDAEIADAGRSYIDRWLRVDPIVAEEEGPRFIADVSRVAAYLRKKGAHR